MHKINQHQNEAQETYATNLLLYCRFQIESI